MVATKHSSRRFLSNIGQAISYTAIGFFFLYAVQAVWLIPLFILVMSVTSLVAKPVWLWLPRRIGKGRSFVLASVIWILVTVTWFTFWSHGTVTRGNPMASAGQSLGPDQLLILLRGSVIGLVNGGFVLLILSMMTDAVDYQRRMAETANEGVFSGLFLAFEKLAFALGPLIAGFVMSASGFKPSHGMALSQSSEAVLGIVLLYSLIPAFMQIAAVAVFSRYHLPAQESSPFVS